MTTKQDTSGKGTPVWVAKRTAFNLGEKHWTMLTDLVTNARTDNHRANMTTVIEEAIENLHKVKISV